MPVDRVRGEDLTPKAEINAAMFSGEFEVVADAISIDDGEVSGRFEKGEVVQLGRDAARALLREGSIKRPTK
jgi:tagatose-1,6-bisphosphate aldolase